MVTQRHFEKGIAMLVLTFYTPNGKPQRYDLHVPLPDGTLPHKLTGPDLYRTLVKLRVPDIFPTDGWQQLALAHARWRQANPLDAPVDTRDGPQIAGSAAVGKTGETV
jgi:hypothetical protein